MTDKTCWQSFKAEGANVSDKLNEVIREGNARRVVVEHQGKTVAEFPLTIGVIGAVIAPVAAAIGGIVALLKDCTIRIERDLTPELPTPEGGSD
ncbi:MAG: DUF4342 domain-containing protein [Vicinamibacterales bacterium]